MDIQKALQDGYTPEQVMGELANRGVKMDYKKALSDGYEPMDVLSEMGERLVGKQPEKSQPQEAYDISTSEGVKEQLQAEMEGVKTGIEEIRKKTVKPLFEIGGTVGGALVGAGIGGVGAPIGAGLGYAAGKRAGEFALGEEPSAAESIRELPEDITIGVAGELLPAATDLIKPSARKAGQYLYEKALKPSTTAPKGQDVFKYREKLAKTAYDEGAILTRKGLKRFIDRKDQLGKDINFVIDNLTEQGNKVAIKDVAKYIDDLKPLAMNYREPKTMLKLLDSYKKEFIKQNKALGRDFLTPRQLQDFKTQQYQLFKSSYGEMKPMGKETEKALARGAKEALENMAPELKRLNQKHYDIKSFLNVAEKEVVRQRNRSWIGMGVWGPLRVVADSPLSLSKAAKMFRAIDKTHPLSDPKTLKKLIYYKLYYGNEDLSQEKPGSAQSTLGGQ